VGGDYYDFLELRPGLLALVLADIVGKGVSGALLMANLQANLRSQYALALDDLPRLLESVNQLFYENTTDTSMPHCSLPTMMTTAVGCATPIADTFRRCCCGLKGARGKISLQCRRSSC